MAENNTKPEIADKAEDMPDTEQPVQDSQPDGQTDSPAESTPAASRKKKRLGPWLFLLLIFVGLPAAWLLSPPDMHQQARDALNQIASRTHLIQQNTNHPSSADSMMPRAEPVASAPEQADGITSEDIQAEPDVTATPSDASVLPGKSAASTSPSNIAASSALQARQAEADAISDVSDLDNMRKQIKQLQNSLDTTLAERDALHTQLLASQQRELSSRLQWISRPETRLVQRAELWREIASLPELSAKDRDRAKPMIKLADDNRAKIEVWRKTLSRLAESIPDTQQQDILPKPENPFLAWLIGTFHLRPAPGKSDLMQASLRHQLMHMEHAFSREDWPTQAEWKTLIADLHEQFGADTDLGLPESLLPTLRETEILRGTANSWLEAL